MFKEGSETVRLCCAVPGKPKEAAFVSHIGVAVACTYGGCQGGFWVKLAYRAEASFIGNVAIATLLLCAAS